MTKDKALDLALEALEESKTNNDTMEFHDRKNKAITAIKQARSAPVQPVAFNAGVPPLYPEMKDGETISVEYTNPPAQPTPVQEPVAHCEAGPEYCQQCHLEDRSLALAAAVRYVKNNTPKLVSDEICMALASIPAAQRQWVGLTNDEVNEFAAGCHLGNSVQGAIYKAEAKLKEKNNG